MPSRQTRLIVLVAVAVILTVVLIVRLWGPSTESLVRRAESGNDDQRVQAIRTLSEGKAQEEAAAALVNLVRDSNPRVASEAITAVGQMRRREDLPVLHEAISDARPQVREAAIVAVGRVGDKASGPALMGVLEGGTSDDEKAAAIDALGRIRYLGSLPRVFDFLNHTSVRVRRSAAAAIVRIWRFDHKFKADAPEPDRVKLAEGMRRHWDHFYGSGAYYALKESLEKPQ